MKQVRCAIYTRKSSDEGLEQSFNSLDAQREACGAYILSQASEGWTALPEVYDDGGLSGGTLERPALQRLLTEVAAGRIDIIVVYKVDRLTRSLLDFSKLVEAFDKHGTSFVSVTQSFNTTTSMGRLTLNMLLSFAQFEREVTAERIRDKIAASKARGMWMGGTPPLGYRPDGRSLAIVEEHALVVRHLFERYLALGNVRLLEAELKDRAIRVPARVTTSGKTRGGGWFSRGLLHHTLRRIIYTGKIAHKDQVYPGQHPAIINDATFGQVQAMLDANIQGSRARSRATSPSLLAGKLVDDAGRSMIASHASKGATRYRYYISRNPLDDAPASFRRIPAREIEKLVGDQLANAFADPLRLIAKLQLEIDPADYALLADRARTLAAAINRRDRSVITPLIRMVQISADRITISCDAAAFADALDMRRQASAVELVDLVVDARLTRTGHVMRIVHDDGTILNTPSDQTLIGLVLKARRWWYILRAGEVDIRTLAAREGISKSYVSRVVRLAFLSPEVVQAILAGKQRAGIDGALLKRVDAIDPSWAVQRGAFLPTKEFAGTERY